MLYVFIAIAVLLVAGIWFFLRWKGNRERPIHSFVWLLKETRQIDEAILETIVSQATGVMFEKNNDDATDFIVGEPGLPTHVIAAGGRMMILDNFPVPYIENPKEFAQNIADMRRSRAFAEHRAWLSIDLMGTDEYDEAELEAGYKVLAKIASGLAGDDCLALLLPAQDWLIPFSPELIDALDSDDPMPVLAAVGEVPVVGVAHDDPRMEAAVQEARNKLPQFVEAFENRNDNQHFAFKARFEEGSQCEYMWLKVTAIENNVVYGILDNDPINIKRLKAGDQVQASYDQLSDWIIMDGDDMIGGFTIKVVGENM